MLDDICAIEVNVFHQRSAIFAVENHVFFFSRRPPPLHYYADRVWRPLGRVRDVWRNKERLALAHNVIHDAVALADTHLDVAF